MNGKGGGVSFWHALTALAMALAFQGDARAQVGAVIGSEVCDAGNVNGQPIIIACPVGLPYASRTSTTGTAIEDVRYQFEYVSADPIAQIDAQIAPVMYAGRENAGIGQLVNGTATAIAQWAIKYADDLNAPSFAYQVFRADYFGTCQQCAPVVGGYSVESTAPAVVQLFTNTEYSMILSVETSSTGNGAYAIAYADPYISVDSALYPNVTLVLSPGVINGTNPDGYTPIEVPEAPGWALGLAGLLFTAAVKATRRRSTPGGAFSRAEKSQRASAVALL